MAEFEIPKTMRGVWLTGHGGPEVLDVRNDIPVPTPGPRDVLIRVAAAGINNTDINTRTAWYSKADAAAADATWSGTPLQFPRIQGIDACGEIVAVGGDVPAGRVGERVIVDPCLREVDGRELSPAGFLGSESDGGFAEYLVVAARQAHRIDSPLTDVELASFPCAYSTAENMLVRCGVREGDRVLVTGASGGVGSAAVQLALARGADVVAVTSPEKAQDLLDLGATETVARDADLVAVLGRDSLDVVVDLVAGPAFPAFLDVLRPFGRYAVAGAIGGAMVDLDIRSLYLKDLSFFGCTVQAPEVFPGLVRLIESGKVAPLVAKTFPLEDIAVAQELFATKKFIGNIVLTVRDPG